MASRSVRELNFAVQQAQEQLPVVQEELKKTIGQIGLEEQRKKNIEQKRDDELASLNRAIGTQNFLMDQIRKKRKFYATMNIETMMRLHQSEPRLQNERKHQQEILETLTKQFADVEAKYKNLFEQLDLNLERFKNIQETELNRLRDEIRQKREQDLAEMQQQLEDADSRYQTVRDEIDLCIESLQDDKYRAEQKLKELRLWQPYANEKATLKEELQQLEVEEKESAALKHTKEQEIERLRAEALTEEEKVNSGYKIECERLQHDQQQLQAKLDKL